MRSAPVSQVVARKVALKRAGREFKGLSPFKQEKTPSFTVNDQKGFYHCFASGEHGDIFSFVVKTEGLSFPEAVERLGQEARRYLDKRGLGRDAIGRFRLGYAPPGKSALKDHLAKAGFSTADMIA